MESEKPEQPKKPFGRSLSDFGVLKSGERKLLDACEKGEPANFGNAVPESASDENCVRAEFLRFLLLGGDEQAPVHEHGVQLKGAYIDGELNLSRCNIAIGLFFVKCFLPKKINAQDAIVGGSIALEGCYLAAGFFADRLKCAAGLFMRNGFRAAGVIRLSGAKIGGDLDCCRGEFEVSEGVALYADGAEIRGGVYFQNGFKTSGTVNLIGANIGQNLDCSGGRFEVNEGIAIYADGVVVKGSVNLTKMVREDGTEVAFSVTAEVRLPRAQIGHDLNCHSAQFQVTNSYALSIDGAVVRGGCFLCKFPESACVDASHADVAVLVDDVSAWASKSVLDGLRYASFGGLAKTSGKIRLEWLNRQPKTHLEDTDFRPQPWRQLQRVLREMGHTEDAKQVGIAYEKHLRKIGRVGQSAKDKNFIAAWWRRVTSRSAHYVFGLLAGFGYRPMRLVTWMLAVWLACGAAYWHLSLAPYRAIAPSAPLIFQDANYINCQPDQPGPPQPPANWYLCDELRSEYATFSPLAYSLDLMLPVVDLGQEKAWGAFIPAANAVWWKELFTHWAPGHVVRLITWFQILFGWVSSLLLVAIISGFSRRNDES